MFRHLPPIIMPATGRRHLLPPPYGADGQGHSCGNASLRPEHGVEGQAEEGSVPSQLIQAQDLLFHLNYCFTLIICFNLIIGAPAKVKQVGTVSVIFVVFNCSTFQLVQFNNSAGPPER